MAKKQNKEVIKGISNVPNYKLMVQKSYPLFDLWQSNLTLPEFKIMDIYLSRINSHDPEHRTVVFEKGELEQALGVVKIPKGELVKRLKHLMGNVVEIKDDDEAKGFRLVTLFEEADIEQDDNGIWQIKLECTQKAMKYIFNIDNLGYLRYNVKLITSITSRYSYIMFCYLQKNAFRKTWEVNLEELRKILNCNAEWYNQYKFFNSEILKKCYEELNNKVGFKYTYESIKKGRKVSKIKFTVKGLKNFDVEMVEPKKDLLDEVQPEEVIDAAFDEKNLLIDEDAEFEQEVAMSEHEQKLHEIAKICDSFTIEQVELLVDLAIQLPENEEEGALLRYFATRYIEFKVACIQNNVKHPYAYFKKMIENDLEQVRKAPPVEAEMSRAEMEQLVSELRGNLKGNKNVQEQKITIEEREEMMKRIQEFRNK